jgi:23S rRNA pseudouridine1911/1915/1917 synthase
LKTPAQTFHQVIPLHAKGMRVDVFAQRQFPQLSRSLVKKLIVDGWIRVGGLTIKASYALKGGERLEVNIPPPEAIEAEPEDFPLEIIYEDRDMLVINKPAEKVVHPGAGIKGGTLVSAILHHCKDLSGIGGKLRPGIVHRLDKGTSGVLLIAKNDCAHVILSEQFKMRQIKKTYLAFVWGIPRLRQGVMDKPLGRDRKDRKKISSRTAKARSARTRYRMLQNFGPISLLELEPETGRTHQIRAHLSELGHPVVGDPVYGKGLRRLAHLPKELQERIKALPFQLLHALRLQFRHPVTGMALDLTAPLRREMGDFQEALKHAFL